MQSTDATYRSIVSGPYSVEYKAEINGVTYDQSTIYSIPKISSALFEKFSVGNAVASSLILSVYPQGTIPPMSSVDIYFRVKNATQTSSWFPKGKFFIDVRKLNKDGVLSLECYDAMLKTEYTFMESGAWTERSARSVVNTIASDIGVYVEQSTLDTLYYSSLRISSIPVIGEDGTTGRDILCGIASALGGNFIMDELGQLKLVQLVAPTTTHSIGVLATALDKADAFDPIDRVILRLDDKSGFKSPASTFDTLTGRVLEAYCPWTTQEYADELLSIVSGYIYQPYEATGATIDPACQLGDGVTVNGLTSAIYSEEITLDSRCAVDISAPYEEEVNHEYPYRSPAQRIVENAVSREDLAIAGRTEINGSNIHSGTITLGGDNNGDGEMIIVDENNVQIGKWDMDGLIIFDDTASDAVARNARFKVVRKGSDVDTDYGIQMGATQVYNAFFPDQYPNEVVPFIRLNGTLDGLSSNGELLIMANSTLSTSGIITRTSGKQIANQNLVKWGRMCQLTLVMQGSNDSYNIYSGTSVNIFQGTVAEEYRPKVDVMGVGYYDAWCYVGRLQPNGTLTVRLTGYGTGTISSNSIISLTYLI